jgi:hypothetical protein
LRGRPSNHRTAPKLRQRVLALYARHFFDCGPALAAELLAERHHLAVHPAKPCASGCAPHTSAPAAATLTVRAASNALIKPTANSASSTAFCRSNLNPSNPQGGHFNFGHKGGHFNFGRTHNRKTL